MGWPAEFGDRWAAVDLAVGLALVMTVRSDLFDVIDPPNILDGLQAGKDALSGTPSVRTTWGCMYSQRRSSPTVWVR